MLAIEDSTLSSYLLYLVAIHFFTVRDSLKRTEARVSVELE